jgi:hypothetical protein
MAPVAAVQFTYRRVVEIEVYVGVPGAPGTGAPGSTGVVADALAE